MDNFLKKSLGISSVGSVFHAEDLIAILEKHVSQDELPDLVRLCYKQLDVIRTKHFEYDKTIQQTEYDRCMQNLVIKFSIKVLNIGGNIEKIRQFANGSIGIDDLDKKNLSDVEDKSDIREDAERCILCGVGKIAIIDNYKNCDECMGIY